MRIQRGEPGAVQNTAQFHETGQPLPVGFQAVGVFRCPNSGMNSGHERCPDIVIILFLFGNNCLNIN
jgi:hypothetical protein